MKKQIAIICTLSALGISAVSFAEEVTETNGEAKIEKTTTTPNKNSPDSVVVRKYKEKYSNTEKSDPAANAPSDSLPKTQ